MAASDQSVESVREMAENAIQRINQLTSARSGNVVAVVSRLSGSETNSALSQRSPASSAVVTDGQSNKRSHALEELRRFPTISREELQCENLN